MDNILVTICARGGSKGLKRKNIRNLSGYPLIYYTIKQATTWGKAKRIIVSTDSKEIAKIAKKYGAEVPFLRPAKLSRDTSAKIPAIRHALLSCEKIFKEHYDMVMDLDVTAPIRNVKDLNNCYKLFIDKDPKTLFSVVEAKKNPYFNMVEVGSDGKAKYCKINKNINRRQDAPPVYSMNASIYIYKREYLLNRENIKPVSNNSIVYIMNNLSAIDIDDEMDLKFIEFLIKGSIIKL